MARPGHPVRIEALRQGRTMSEVAAGAGYSKWTLYDAVKKYERSSARLRQRVADELGKPEAELWPKDERR